MRGTGRKGPGREDEYRFFLHRSLNDRNLFNAARGLMNGKTSDGRWAPTGGPEDTEDNRSLAGWTEGDAWVYTWSPLHDQAGLIQLMGGREAYAAKLDAHFNGGHNVHSNKPSITMRTCMTSPASPGRPRRRRARSPQPNTVRTRAPWMATTIADRCPPGCCLRQWGSYPVNPASGEYMIGSPMYSRVSIRLQSGKRFRVVAENVSDRNFYGQSATLDGRALNVPLITWEQIQSGATLKFGMGPKPSRRGSDWRPPVIPSK